MDSIDPQTFVRDFLEPGIPLIVTGQCDITELAKRLNWAALVESFPDARVPVFGDLFTLRRIVPLRRFYEKYVLAAETDASAASAYLRWYARYDNDDGFPYSDDIFASIADAWELPAFLRAPGYLVPFAGGFGIPDPRVDAHPGRGIFLSSAGGRTRSHVDPWGSEAILLQIAGRKYCRVSPPGVETSDDAAITGWLEPGQVMFIPCGWNHEVDTVENSITIGWNFVHHGGFKRFWAYQQSDAGTRERDFLEYFVSSPLATVGAR